MAVRRISNLENIPENQETSVKRVPPPLIQKVLDYDAQLTQDFSKFLEQNLPVTITKSKTKFLEISGSFFVWFPLCVLMFILHGTFSKQSSVNLLLGLMVDIVIIALLKAFARRKRPEVKKEDYFKSVGPDKYSFPSGHASRSVLLAIMYTQLIPLFDEWILYSLSVVLLWTWSFTVCLSRIINGRHYVLDVVAGVLTGFAESCVVQLLWRSPEQADSWFDYFNNYFRDTVEI